MEIIRDGREFEVTCGMCKSVLRVAKTDIKENFCHGGAFCICAVCQHAIDIPFARIPQSWLVEIFPDS